MDVRFTPKKLGGNICAISSKSDAHRILICSMLADDKTVIKIDNLSRDIEATISCIKSLGGKVLKEGNYITVTPVNKGISSPILDCFESGSTLRFLFSVASLICENPTFTGKGRLPQRPLSPLREEMEKNGCQITKGNLPITINGRLTGGTYELAGDVSSQFISGLLFALPLCAKDSKIVLTTPLESKGYVNMTLSSLKAFGIEICERENEYIIKGNQKYISPKEISVEGDWSNAAFWLCGAALGGTIECDNLSLLSHQGDKEIVSVLKLFGADVSVLKNKVIAKHNLLSAISIDCTDIPDLVPIISAVAAVSKETTVLTGVKRLKIKESDRLKAISDTLSLLGGNVKATHDSLIIKGRDSLSGGTVDSFNDHRIAMMAAIASIKCENPVIVKNFEATDKSYPDFLTHYKSLGGVFDVL